MYLYIYFSKHITMRHRREATILRNLKINARSEDTSYTHLLFLFNMHYQNVTSYHVIIY